MSAVLLLQLAAKAAVVLALTWTVATAMRRASASARHMVWAIGLVATLALPLVRVVGPTWNVSVPESAWPAAAAPVVADPLTPVPVPETTAPRARVAVVPGPGPGPETATQGLGSQETASASSLPLGFGLWDLGLGIWALGAFVLLARLVYGVARARRIAAQATDVEDDSWLMAFDAAAAALEIDRRVALRQTAATSVPVACGIWRPSILLPADALTWSEERRAVVLLHELAHVRRRDCLVQAVAQLTVALHWMNPLAHLALARLRAEQERACDDLVLEAGTDAPVYADHLFEIARSFRAPSAPAWATLAMARPSQLEGRLMAILDERLNRAPLARRARIFCAMAAATALVALGALHVTTTVNADERSGGDGDDVQLSASRTWVVPGGTASVSARAEAAGSASASADSNADSDSNDDANADVNDGLNAADGQQALNPQPAPPAPSTQAQNGVSDETRRRVADALATALNDDNAEVRERALEGLASMQDARAIPALLRGLRDQNPDLREDALNAIAQFDTPEALEGLVGALKDSSPDVREHAVRHVGAKIARGRLEASRYTATFVGLLRDQTPDVRESAARSLGMIADPATIDPLTAALKDPDAGVREEAARALAMIARGQRRGPRGPFAVPPVPPNPPVAPRPIAGLDISRLVEKALTISDKALEKNLDDLARDFDKFDLK